MWCTRWFLPLLLLPMPTAPAYFLFLFLVSLTMHARPCIYCIMLLSSLFASSCYWQPMPTSYLVSRHPTLAPPAAANITLPALTAFPERCWCDLYDTIFSPFNVTRWEQRALYRVVRPAIDEFKKTHEDILKPKDANKVQKQQPSTERAGDAKPALPLCAAGQQERHWLLRGHGPLTRFLVDRIAGQKACRLPPSGTETAASPAGPASAATVTEDAAAQSPLPWLRRKYDLSPYGIGVILDFGIAPDDS